jgi:hypothetical protein
MNKNYSKNSTSLNSAVLATEPSTKTIEAILNYSKSVSSVKVLNEQTLVHLN